jgi:hypothetical protein
MSSTIPTLVLSYWQRTDGSTSSPSAARCASARGRRLADGRCSGAFTLRRRSTHGTRVRRSYRYGACDTIRMWAIRKLPVATDNALLAPEPAADIARVKSAKSNRRQVRQLAHPPEGPGAPERAGHRDHEGAARPSPSSRRAARPCAAPVRRGGTRRSIPQEIYADSLLFGGRFALTALQGCQSSVSQRVASFGVRERGCQTRALRL